MAENDVYAERFRNIGRTNEVPDGIEIDSTGNFLVPDSMQKTYHEDSVGRIETISVTDGTSTWVKTVTYPNAYDTVISQWVKQP